MKSLFNISVLLLFIKILIGCATAPHVDNNSPKGNIYQYEIVSKQEFPDNTKFIFSSDSTKVLCAGNRNKFSHTFSFFVFSINQNQKVSDTFNNVEIVEWVDNSTIKYKFLSGNIKREDGTIRYRYIKFEKKY